MTLLPTTRLQGHTQPVLCVQHAKDSFLGDNVIASGSEDNTCRIWDLRTQRVLKGIKGLQDPVSSVSFAPLPESSLFYLSSGTKVLTYDLRNTSVVLSEATREYNYSGDEINSIDVNRKQTHLATADDNGEVKVIDLTTHKIYKKMTKKHNSICMSVKFSHRKAWEVWSSGLDCKLFQWDFSKGKPTAIYDTASSQPPSSQMFNPPFGYTIQSSLDGDWVAAGLGDASIQLLHFGDKKLKTVDPTEIRLENGHSNMVNCLSFLPLADHTQHLLSGAANGSIALWNLSSLVYNTQHKPQQLWQLDSSVQRLNQLETWTIDGKVIQLAAAGLGGENGTNGILNIYSLI